MSKQKTIEDLTKIELLEDIEYYLQQTQLKSPSFVDEMFTILRKYTTELTKRIKNE